MELSRKNIIGVILYMGKEFIYGFSLDSIYTLGLDKSD